MKRLLIINGHPDNHSFCYALSQSYAEGATSTGESEVQFLNIRDLDFNLNLAFGYKKRTELEPDLLHAQQLIKWADHVVVTYPTWFGS